MPPHFLNHLLSRVGWDISTEWLILGLSLRGFTIHGRIREPAWQNFGTLAQQPLVSTNGMGLMFPTSWSRDVPVSGKLEYVSERRSGYPVALGKAEVIVVHI
jgi:hypothetical protein